MTHLITWWTALDWPHAAFWMLAVVILLFTLACLIGKCMSINEAPPVRRDYPLADYSAQYREKVEWLGDDFLLAKPINRRVTR